MGTEDTAVESIAHAAAPAVDLPDVPAPSHDPRAAADAIRPQSGVAVSSHRELQDRVRGGIQVPQGQRVVLNWTSANRDEQVFGDPDRFDPAGNAGKNLAHGRRPNACPGRPVTPTDGYASVPVVLTPAP